MILETKKIQSYFFRIIGATVAVLLFLTNQLHCQTFNGNVTKIVDADTVQFRATNGKYCTVRLIGIDAPERQQDYGKECSVILKDAVWSKPITAQFYDTDQYKREVLKLSTAEIPDVSLFMIQSGCAWEYLAPMDLRTAYDSAELTAKNAELNLWSQPNPIKPSVWRQMKRLGLL